MFVKFGMINAGLAGFIGAGSGLAKAGLRKSVRNLCCAPRTSTTGKGLTEVDILPL